MFSPRGSRPAGSTTVVQPAPTPTTTPGQAPPPPLVLKPAPTAVFVEPEFDEIDQRKPVSQQQQPPPEVQVVSRIPQALVQLFPPKNVMPDQFSTQRGRLVMTENLAGDSVGLLRRMSLYPSYLVYLYRHLQEKCSTDPWDSIFTRLFGHAKNRDEFLGYGRRAIPSHDQMGLFPMFSDQHGREYFELPGSNGTEFTVRIPRHLTRRQYARTYTPMNDELMFPLPDEAVSLTPCGLPVFPFYWDPAKNDVRSIAEKSRANEGLFEKRVQSTMSLEIDGKVYQRAVVVRISETSEHREASCLVRIDHGSNPGAFMSLFLPLQVMREEWNLSVSDLFGSLDRMYVSHKSVSEFCAYLQSTWVEVAAKWVRDKASMQRVNKS